MKNKTLIVILSTVLIGCIGLSVYQYNTTVSLKNSLASLTNTKNDLTVEIENKTGELNSITSDIEEANNSISALTADIESLAVSAKDIQAEIESLEEEIAQGVGANSIHDDENNYLGSGLTKEEYDRAVALMNKYLEENGSSGSSGSTGNYNKSPDYISVDGVVDDGIIPEYTVGESGGEGLSEGGTIY